MKKVYFIIIPLILIGYIAVKALPPRAEQVMQDAGTENKTAENKINKFHDNPSERVKQELQCKSCHSAEYPSKNDPGLLNCPREEMISVYHSPSEGPEIVFIGEMSDKYSGVVFSHRVHSEMSEMSEGCTGCHHYNTTGPVMNCRNCHDSKRKREDVSVPDLKAAFHRQCMTCHKQWTGENGCNSQCHKRNVPGEKLNIDSLRGRSHPQLNLPTKLVWETNSKTNKTVTFFHDEHIQIFKIECKKCHNQESCIKCHTAKAQGDLNRQVKIEKSLEEHHKPCSNCHLGNACQKCHKDSEMTPFDHSKSGGWALKSYHSKLECARCHGSRMPYRKLDNNCTSCHRNFTTKFDHTLIGIVFSENHKELECNNCHTNRDFTGKPICTDCHDDRSYPADIPGKKK